MRRSLSLLASLLLLLPVSSEAQAPSSEPQSAFVVLSSYRFTPAPVVLKAGQPVRLVFQNRAGKSHDFTAPEFFAAARLLSGQVPNGRVNVPAGRTITIDLVPAAGTYSVRCGKFMHATMGMRSQVVVR